MPIDTDSDDLETALQKLKARENSLRQAEAVSQLGSWEVNLKTNESIWSDQSYKIYGLDKNSTKPSLELFLSLLIPQDLQRAQSVLAQAMSSGEVVTFQCKVKKTDAEIIDVLLNGQVIFDEDNNPSKLIGSTQDITSQMEIKREANELLDLIKYSTNEIYIISNNSFKYLYVNDGAANALGYSIDELLTMNIFDINPDISKDEAQKLKAITLRDNKLLHRTIHRKKDGSTYYVQSLIHPIKYKNNDAFVIFDTDISQNIEDEKLLKKQAEELNHQANHDALTNLPNRTLFKDRLSQTVSISSRNKEKFALLFIDLDQFKKINDSLGHHVGDNVLIEAAKRLENSLRAEDTLARLGGDEFTVILKNVKSIQSASVVAQKIIDSMKEPIETNGHTLFISSSIGISMFPDDDTTEDNLIKYADTAMYKAKEEGRDNFQFYSSEMTSLAFERVVMESSLRVAIKEEQFVVYFQPQFDALSETITGMEALVRWKHPQIGLVPPGKFIPIAEDSGLIIDIDRIVMKKAMQQFSLWYKDGLNPGTLALNLAMKQLNEEDFIFTLLNTMNSIKFKPKWLELEVTEGQVMDNPNAAIEKLREISDIGIEIAIDDFGTGYSSLAYLKKLPLDKLKIDQSFVRDIPYEEDDVAITKAIIALGRSLNLKLIAEGVETEEQRDFLVANGCSNIQGYFYARPMPIDEITELLKKSSNKT